MSTEPTRPDAASIERGRQIAESMMDHATAAYRRRLAEERSETTHAPAVEPVEPPAGPERGTGEPEAHARPQTADLLDAVRDAHTQCDCDECLGTIAAAVLNAAAESLRRLGHTAAATLLGHTADDLKGTS